MGSPSRYWRFVKLSGRGDRITETVAIARDFFQQQFADLIGQSDIADADISDTQVQQGLHDRFRQEGYDSPAGVCLRCFISDQIVWVCSGLANEFGQDYGFTIKDLLPYVLDDTQLPGSRAQAASQTGYRSIAREILESFDPSKAGLSTWVSRRVRQHHELNQFLLEQGLYLVTDWAILNDTKPQQLTRILKELHSLSDSEIQAAVHLLQSYHSVYRRDRQQQRLAGGGGRCMLPNPNQLVQIAALLPAPQPSSASVLNQLQALAAQLRQYRIAVRRGGGFQSASLNDPATQLEVDRLQAAEIELDNPRSSDPNQTLIHQYRALFITGLDETLAQVIDDRCRSLGRKRSPEQFLTALHLLHCQGWSMTAIAPQVELGGQPQVSRLLQLPDLRADIRQRWLAALRDRVPTLVQEFDSLDRLQDWDQRLDQLLNEEVEAEIQRAVAETSAARNCPLTSLFAQRLCHYLNARLNLSGA